MTWDHSGITSAPGLFYHVYLVLFFLTAQLIALKHRSSLLHTCQPAACHVVLQIGSGFAHDSRTPYELLVPKTRFLQSNQSRKNVMHCMEYERCLFHSA